MTEKGIHDDVMGFFFPRRIRYYLDDLKKKGKRKRRSWEWLDTASIVACHLSTEEEKSPDDDGKQKKIGDCLEITIIFFTHLRE